MSLASSMTRVHSAGGTPLFGRGGGSRENQSAETPSARGREPTDRAVTSRSRVFGSQSVRTGSWSSARTEASAAHMDNTIEAASNAMLDQRIRIAFSLRSPLFPAISTAKQASVPLRTVLPGLQAALAPRYL